jgi:hypothetical protein
MELARHSDPKLTLKTYARVQMHNLTRVLDGMPAVGDSPERKAEAMRATGTDGGARIHADQCPQKSPQSADGSGPVSAAQRDQTNKLGAVPDDRKGLKMAGLGDFTQRGAASDQNAPRRTRTFDPLIKSQLLYQLS